MSSLPNPLRVGLALLGLGVGHALHGADAPAVDAAAATLLERAFVLDAGRDAPRDAAAAAALYRSAADQGDALAHLRLGYLSETGDGVAQDYSAARRHYQAAVDAGLS